MLKQTKVIVIMNQIFLLSNNKKYFKKKTIVLLAIFLVIFILCFYNVDHANYDSSHIEIWKNLRIKKFSPNLSLSRLNRLFKILQKKEAYYGDILDNLGLISFKMLVDFNLRLNSDRLK
jgi:hypothetical protein